MVQNENDGITLALHPVQPLDNTVKLWSNLFEFPGIFHKLIYLCFLVALVLLKDLDVLLEVFAHLLDGCYAYSVAAD